MRRRAHELHGHRAGSHPHWDHVQGLPFFPPLHRPEAKLHIVGPSQQGQTLEAAFDLFLCPPYFFPVTLGQLAGTVTFEEATKDPIELGAATVLCRDVPTSGPPSGSASPRVVGRSPT